MQPEPYILNLKKISKRQLTVGGFVLLLLIVVAMGAMMVAMLQQLNRIENDVSGLGGQIDNLSQQVGNPAQQ